MTTDAIGGQGKIAEPIIAQGADYVLGLRGNQSTLYEQVERSSAAARAGHHDNNPPSLLEPVRAEALQAATLAETPRGWLERQPLR